MGLIERAERSFCLEKCMILVSVDGFFQFLPKLVEEKVSSRTEKTGKNHGKNHPLEETANPANWFYFKMADKKHTTLDPVYRVWGERLL